ncbi:FdhF/YdeP family oxidoreductase [Notoacmeibacter ruber]|uniref:Formate dehydrogenase n=1 Tax=Notoacmeibacter ruber TaxID=2670375 RepID=A0A3L7JIR5_9HYPH|nr:FdhF/YdeP family oxidoreductase [Notoacmeibacter ruber]RLQ88382.1 formate dehydrogenase [Notoacmeibacter ruber]
MTDNAKELAKEGKTPHYDSPAGGWGSLRGIAEVTDEASPEFGVADTLRRQNKPGGFMCTSCAWPKPANYHPFEFCENGAKATVWELTSDRCTPEFFEQHTVSELRNWTDHELEMTGRLTEPMRYDAASDRYVRASWEEAFSAIGTTFKRLDPKSTVFYSSGHAGLEASYLYALFARLYGHNNLPQSSNMCHETTSVGLKKVIGSSVGTVIWDDLEETDAFFFFGQNPGTNSPRFLRPLAEAKQRGAKIVTFNPLREQGLVSFVDPQSPVQMMTGKETKISHRYYQLKSGGDVAAILGLCKYVIEKDDEAQKSGGHRVIDQDFIDQHTTGFDEFIEFARAADWSDIEKASGLSETDLREAGHIYISCERVIGVYGMGLTQHSHGALNIAMLVNLLCLRGNIGKDGAGCCPVRGHSNVQGQRTVGISEKPSLIPNDKLRELFGFEPPMDQGYVITEALQATMKGEVKAILSLGGNLCRALPERDKVEQSWSALDLTAMISTKLNRSHLFPGKEGWILPCLGRAEIDRQATGNQYVSVEDSFSCIHGSVGHRSPASEHLKSELAIVAGLAKATLPANPKVKWDEWTADYSHVRNLIEACYPDDFHDYNARLNEPGGFWRGNSARERIWETESGKAVITTPDQLHSRNFEERDGRYILVTLRSNDQFNTTIYGYSDRFRGIEGTRDVVLMNQADIDAAGLEAGETVTLFSDDDTPDGGNRRLGGLTLTPYNIPRGTIAGYYPECNVLIGLMHGDEISKTPASKSIPVRIEREEKPSH